ncbi:phage late control D family protein [Vibrio parahaemolyticus]|nr:phage late control D family protein [Vibrio parahaemolyticus]MBE4530576.1 phage late control D family protein [Vibrio parahaemolyticus]HAV1337876.1 phage late control D family protein [Vibrio parahaemolyticus]HAV1421201.1 phage late control D family protein [Vibrio parahaemolyticus]HAV1545393.1 phage late control D family protein [Vibrio parahaemolyticus]
MGLGLIPQVRVNGPGEAFINSRLISWERVDAAGLQSDQITLTVDTAGQTGIPHEGAVLRFSEGYDGNLVDKGEFKITRIVPRLFPPTVTIVATAAPFQVEDKTGFKERRTRTFENISLAELFRQVVSPHGYSPRVASEFESVQLAHVDQIDETDSAFLTRLAKERDAVAKPVNDLYVLARRGQVKTITGQQIPPVTVAVPGKNDPSDLGQFINCQLEKPSRTNVSGVKAKWIDNSNGQEHEVQSGQAPFKKLRQAYESESTAKQSCDDELKKVQRQGASVRLDLPGDPYLVAEGLLTLNDTFPEEMAGNWSIDKVTARGDASGGYRCAVVATQPSK